MKFSSLRSTLLNFTILSTLFAAATLSNSAFAYFQMDFMKGKRAKVEAKQWTLADWLTQKNKNRLQDHWLSLNTKDGDWFEIAASGGLQEYQTKTEIAGVLDDATGTGSRYAADLYITFINLTAEYETTSQDMDAQAAAAGVRILGATQQSTYLLLRYGQRDLDFKVASEKFKNQFAEAALRLYILNFVGLNGSYRHYLSATSNLDAKLSGHRSSAGIFLESGFIRLSAEYFSEPLKIERVASDDQLNRQGYELGLSILF